MRAPVPNEEAGPPWTRSQLAPRSWPSSTQRGQKETCGLWTTQAGVVCYSSRNGLRQYFNFHFPKHQLTKLLTCLVPRLPQIPYVTIPSETSVQLTRVEALKLFE